MTRGFTLVEILITIFVLTIGVFAAYAAVQQPFFYSSIATSRLTGAYLAQEGIELVRNLRDASWLNGGWDDWVGSLPDNSVCFTSSGNIDCANIPATVCRVDYGANVTTGPAVLSLDNGYYNHGNGEATRFNRILTFFPSGDSLKVKSQMCWTERGKTYEITAEEDLYNWYPE